MTTGSTPDAQVSGVVDELVAQQYMRDKVWNNVVRVNPTLERLQMKGLIDTDASGTFLELKARVGQHQKQQRGDLEERKFSRKQHYVTYRFPWSWHEVIAALSERDIAILGTKDAIYRRQKVELTNMGNDFHDGLNLDVLQSNAATNSVGGITSVASAANVPLYGLLTFFDYGSTTYAWNPFTKTASATATAIAATKEIRPDGTYGGITTRPNTPIAGVDQKYFEATSPVIVHSDSTGWTGTATWASACLVCTSYLINRLTRSNKMSDRPDMMLLTSDDWETMKQTIRSSTYQQVILSDEPQSPDAGMYPRRMFRWEGVDVLYDLDMPANIQLMLNTNHLRFSTLGMDMDNFLGKKGPIKGDMKSMFKVDMDKTLDQGAWRVVAQMCGQLFGNPYYQGMGYTGF